MGIFSVIIRSSVQVKNYVHDLPRSIDLEQGEQVREPGAGPVVEFKPHGGDRANEVDACDPGFKPRRGTVVVIPVIKLRARL